MKPELSLLRQASGEHVVLSSAEAGGNSNSSYSSALLLPSYSQEKNIFVPYILQLLEGMLSSLVHAFFFLGYLTFFFPLLHTEFILPLGSACHLAYLMNENQPNLIAFAQ